VNWSTVYSRVQAHYVHTHRLTSLESTCTLGGGVLHIDEGLLTDWLICLLDLMGTLG